MAQHFCNRILHKPIRPNSGTNHLQRTTLAQSCLQIDTSRLQVILVHHHWVRSNHRPDILEPDCTSPDNLGPNSPRPSLLELDSLRSALFHLGRGTCLTYISTMRRRRSNPLAFDTSFHQANHLHPVTFTPFVLLESSRHPIWPTWTIGPILNCHMPGSSLRLSTVGA